MPSFYEWFYDVILTTANSVPIQSLWVAFFLNPFNLNKSIEVGNRENGYGYYSLFGGAATNTGQSLLGALFANSVTIPGDGMNVSKIGPEGSGLIKGNISAGRNEMDNLSISFLDTNMSFTDYNIRPWTIYANHKSLKDNASKTTVIVMQLAKSGYDNPLIPRAIWTFHDACPVSIKSEEWNYGEDNVVKRQVEFAYNYYLLNADPGLTAIKTISSLLNDPTTEYTSQPVSVSKGGLSTHGGNEQIIIPSDSKTTQQSHPEGEPVTIDSDDIVSRGLNIGLEILNGNSNVAIASDDAIDRLKSQAEALAKNIKIGENDTPNHTSTNQTGHIPKEPVGPIKGEDDHITRREPTREQSGSVPVGGNSKESTKGLLDTPLFFPGDGAEGSKKIVGRTVDGELDTPEILTIKNQKVTVEKTGDVGKNIPLQIVTINKEDNLDGIKVDSQKVVVNKEDNLDGIKVDSQHVVINKEDTPRKYGTPKIVTINKGDRR